MSLSDAADLPSGRREKLLVRPLLRWFAQNARDLPWRRSSDPYAIWVSEVMLQQTQVKTVLPYWIRWMDALPTVQHLAKAPVAQLHKLWEGLGYYSRARNLQKAARRIVSEHDGKIPADAEHLLDLPGIGRYTAGAIRSIAYNQPAPILDGNVSRVLARVYAVEGDLRERGINARLWTIAESLVLSADRLPPRVAGVPRQCAALNESLMELGALVCTPQRPNCPACPIRSSCVAFQTGRTSELPHKSPRPKPTRRKFFAFVAERRGRLLVQQRPVNVVNGGLWEFPNVEVALSEATVEDAASHLFRTRTLKCKLLCRIRHTITRYRITVEAFRVSGDATALTAKCPQVRWCKRSELSALAFTSAHRKILSHCMA